MLTLGGCTRTEEPATAPVGPVPAASQRAGDPEAGYDLLVNGGYVSCGIPYSAWSRTAPPQGSGPEVEGRRGRNGELPYYLSAHTDDQGVEIVSTNCLWCHGGVFNGELIIGLGDETRDFTRDPRDLFDRVGAYVAGEAETAAWRKWAQRVDAVAPYMITDTVGVNPAPSGTRSRASSRLPPSPCP